MDFTLCVQFAASVIIYDDNVKQHEVLFVNVHQVGLNIHSYFAPFPR